MFWGLSVRAKDLLANYVAQMGEPSLEEENTVVGRALGWLTPPKSNIDTKNDVFFFNVSPLKNGYFGYPC